MKHSFLSSPSESPRMHERRTSPRCALPSRIVLALLTTLLSILLACSGTQESALPSVAAEGGADATPPEAGTCPFPGTECFGACRPIEGYRRSSQGTCLERTVIGCSPGGFASTDAPCFKRVEDGTLFLVNGSSVAGRPGWVHCSPSESQTMELSPC